MKLSLIILVLSSIISTGINAQDNSNKKFDKSALFGLGGPGFGISANYQQKIISATETNGLFFRAGIGVLGPIPGRDGGALFISFPAGFHYQFSKSARFEIGAGCTPFTFTNDRLSLAGFASFAFYPLKEHNARIVFSPFFSNRNTLKYYLNVNSPILLYGGFEFMMPLNKK